VRAVLLSLVVAGCASAPDPAGTPAPPPRAERPVYAVGDRWIRSDGVYDLLRVEDDRYVFSAGPEREVHLTQDLGLAKVVKGAYVVEFSPPTRLPWPLEVGKAERTTGTFAGSQLTTAARGTGGAIWRTGPTRSTWTVDRYEEVTVPAGREKAFRLSLEIQHTYFTNIPFELKLWYAPRLRQIVKAESRTLPPLSFEVVAVEQDPQASLRVTLESPPDQARLGSPALLVSGRASSGAGITRVTVTLNAVEVSRIDTAATPRPVVRLSVPVTLRRGQNVLLVTATDASGETVQEARTVHHDPDLRAATDAPRAASGPVAGRLLAWLPERPGLAVVGDAGAGLVAQTDRAASLEMALAEPRDQARVDHDSIALAGVVRSAKGVSRVLVTVNGREVGRLDETASPRSLAMNFPLTLREGRNIIVVTATETDGTHYQEVRAVHYERPVPLQVAIRYPEDRARVSDEVTVLAAVLTSSRGIAQVAVAVNGAEAHQQTERTPQKSLAIAVPLTLRPGPNAIVLTVSEPDGTRRQEVRTVVLDKTRSEAAAPPPPPVPVQPDRWAVVIGAGRYEDPAIPRLQYTVPDADAMHRFLTGPGGFKPEHVLLLTDRTERKPTLRNLKWALGTFLARSARKDDTVLIFFAGHGAPEPDPRGLERDGLAKYLVPTDADLDDLYATALPMEELQTIFGRIEAERIVVMLDACYSGSAGGRTFASRRTRASQLDDLFLDRLTRARGRAIITAARPSEVSIELPDLGHGLFTYYLLEGLRGAADRDRDRLVTVQELYEYVERQVIERSRAAGASQHPMMKGELQGALPLVRVAP
jgi:hypothetical protein